MKRHLRPVCLIFALTLGLLSFATAQEKTVKKVAPKPTTATSGKELFRQYCAVCHGQDGKGGGPAADALKQSPNDLTQLSRKNSGKFPEQRVLATLKGEGRVSAHGSADMPVWGPIFTNMSTSLNESQGRIHALLQYVEEIQTK